MMAKCPFSELPVELLACSVSCTLCWAWEVALRSLILSWFMLWAQASAEEAALFSWQMLFGMDERWWEKWAEGLKLVTAARCPLHLDVFSATFLSETSPLLVRSARLCETCGYLLWFARPFDCFWVTLHAALLCWILRLPGFGCKTELGCSYSAAFLEFLQCERLKGKGLVHGFSFLVLPCRKTPKCWKWKIWLIKIFKCRGEWDTYAQRFLLPFTVRQAKAGGRWKVEGLCKHR